MQVSATTQFTLRTFAAASEAQKAFLKSALGAVARGDELALAALEEQTAVSRAQLQAAAEAFANNQLDQVFARDRPGERGRTLGTTPPPVTAPGEGPTAEQLEHLGRQVHTIECEIARERATLVVLTAQAARDKKAAEQAEVGFFGDLVFWSKANQQEKAARDKAAGSAAKIAPQQQKIADLEEQVELTLRGLLANVRDPGYANVAGRVQQLEDVRAEVARTIKVLSAAASAAGAVASDEQWEMWWSGRDFFIPGTDLPEGASALEASQTVVRDYNRAIERYNALNPGSPLLALDPMPEIDSGESLDNVVDVVSGMAGALLGAATGNRDLGRMAGNAASMGASAYVMAQVSKIESAIVARLRTARGSDTMLERRHKGVRAQLDTMLNALRADALQAAGFLAA